jgi:hypothetical protein
MTITNRIRAAVVVLGLISSVAPAAAQTRDDDWKVTIYPILGWIPIFGADVRSLPALPDLPDGPGDGGGDGVSAGHTDSKLNGALLAGLSVAKGRWRAEADGVWAALIAERDVPPALDLDLDIIYGHASGGFRVVKDLYVAGGVRRVALKYRIGLEGYQSFRREPGLWDPLIGVGWHRVGKTLEVHARFDANVFDTGADEDYGGGIRFDWKPIPHFGVAFGYAGIVLKISNTVQSKTFRVEQSLHGPIVGIGLYF